MSYPTFSSQNQLKKAMDSEQFEPILDAILAGKYSWACFLLLQAADYNPVHYIPYRTYNRLIKNNCISQKSEHQQESRGKNRNSPSQSSSNNIENLHYLEEIKDTSSHLQGGTFSGFYGYLLN